MMVMIYDIRLGRWKDGHLYFYVVYKEKEGQHGHVDEVALNFCCVK